MLDLGNGFVARQNVADGEESGLHDGVHAAAHAGLGGYFVSVDDVEFQFLLDDVFLCFARQVIPDLIRTIEAVQQEDGTRSSVLEDVEPFHEREVMAGHKRSIIRPDQIWGADGVRAKAQVRNGD